MDIAYIKKPGALRHRAICFPLDSKTLVPCGPRGRRRGRAVRCRIPYAEREQRAALGNVIESRSLRHGRRSDGAEFVAEIESRRHRQTDPATDSRPHGHVLLTLHGIRDRVADDSEAQLARPENFPGRASNSSEIAAEAAVEGQAA